MKKLLLSLILVGFFISGCNSEESSPNVDELEEIEEEHQEQDAEEHEEEIIEEVPEIYEIELTEDEENLYKDVIGE
jgi:uncharacterized protein YcfL